MIVIDVSLTSVTLVAAAPPIITVAPAAKCVPVIVIAVPPSVVPELGLIAMTVRSVFDGPVGDFLSPHEKNAVATPTVSRLSTDATTMPPTGESLQEAKE